MSKLVSSVFLLLILLLCFLRNKNLWPDKRVNKKGGDLYEGDNWFAQHIEQKGLGKLGTREKDLREENVSITQTYT